MNTKLVGGVAAVLAAAAGLVVTQGRGKGLPAPTVELLGYSQAYDSASYGVSWTAAPSNRPVTYIVEISAEGWIRSGNPTMALADTLWVPVDTVDVTATAIVRATAGNKASQSEPTSFLIAAITILGPPGKPSVVPVGTASALLDSMQLVVKPLLLDSTGAMTDGVLYVVGWLDGPTGGAIPVMCSEQPDGLIGWGQVELIGTTDLRPVAGGAILEDPGCGWSSIGSDSVAFVGFVDSTFVRIPPNIGPVRFRYATVVLAASFTPAGANFGVSILATDTLGTPLAGIDATTTLLAGTWGDGSTAPRVCRTDPAGFCGPGNVTAGSDVRITAERAVPFRRVLSAPAPAGQRT